MSTLRFDGVWNGHQWLCPVYITCDANGNILRLAQSQDPSQNMPVTPHRGWLIPGFHNGHSHAFQFRMAGLAEHQPTTNRQDDFWSWRESMYELALKISPDSIEAIAAILFREMLKQGYTSVAEFHYLHHDPSGVPYSNIAETGERIMKAAQAVGIKLTLVPVYYNQGGFNQPANPRQRRFIFKDSAAYLKLLETTISLAQSHYPGVTVGHGIHSLRAAKQQDIKEVLDPRHSQGPIHLHIAEQVKEVNDCLAAWGQRPIEWLLNNISLNARYNLVHATHMTASETAQLAKSSANAVLCPSTEGNLGDGFFPLLDYLEAGGHCAIGSDSHINLSPTEEIRWLEYQQRLIAKRRNVNTPTGADSGEFLLQKMLEGGRLSTGPMNQTSHFQVGSALDGILLDSENPIFWGKDLNKVLPSFVFSGDARAIKGVICQGQWVVWEGRHQNQKLDASYRAQFIG